MSGLSSYLLSTLSKVGGLGSGNIPDFHYAIGQKMDWSSGRGIWDVHTAQGTTGKRQEATVFVFDKAQGTSHTAAAQNALKRMRTLRHPSIARYLDGAETAEAIYIATEPLEPLALGPVGADGDEGAEELRRWGLFKVAEALRFINNDCKLIHGNVSADSVFVTKAGEWKLSGMELADVQGSRDSGGQHMYRHYTGVIPGYAGRMAPEVEAQQWDRIEQGKIGALDGWGLACLIHQVYNGDLHSASQLQAQGQIPPALWAQSQRLRIPDLRRRMVPAEFLQTALRHGGYLDSSFVRACQFIENAAVKEEDERAEFFAGLDTTISGFPVEFTKHKILPELLKMIEFGGAGSSGHDAKVLSSIVQIGRGMDEAEYNEHIAPAIVQLFGSNDRALRFSLLEHMGSFVQAIPTDLVAKKVFPNFMSGFLDAAPAIREATVKASLAVAPKLGHKALNNDLIKQLVRLMGDPEPGIRTNALICVGKLCTAKPGILDLDSDGVSEASHRYVVCPALLQALRDQFPPVRSAALSVACACAPKWDAVDVARRVIPSISQLLVDGEKPVRAAALKAVGAMVARVEAHAKAMPDTALKKSASAVAAGSAADRGSAAAVSAQTEAAASMAASSDGWSGWAVSSLSSTISGALSLASSLPVAQQQQQQERTLSAPADESAARAGFDSLQRGPSTTVSSPTASVGGPASKPPVPMAAAASTKPVATSGGGGWEFNDDWGDDGTDGWGMDDDDDDGWDADGPESIQTPAAAAAQPEPIIPALPPPRGMAAANPQPSTSKPVMKAPLKLVSHAASKRVGPASQGSARGNMSGNSAAPKRKGLGAMKLGGAPKTEAMLDEFF
ncbi:Nuclear aminoacylation-dependent tRNA export pathway component [Coemansia sp. RSA 552]|nr:Nuclear aminoacylation-dependent tRNA export pathway component [Coemansia sp. RSA 552]